MRAAVSGRGCSFDMNDYFQNEGGRCECESRVDKATNPNVVNKLLGIFEKSTLCVGL